MPRGGNRGGCDGAGRAPAAASAGALDGTAGTWIGLCCRRGAVGRAVSAWETNAPCARRGVGGSEERNSMSPRPSSRSEPTASRIVRESTCDATAKAMRLALIGGGTVAEEHVERGEGGAGGEGE